jgi:hypothetical protein
MLKTYIFLNKVQIRNCPLTLFFRGKSLQQYGRRGARNDATGSFALSRVYLSKLIVVAHVPRFPVAELSVRRGFVRAKPYHLIVHLVARGLLDVRKVRVGVCKL